MIWLAGAASIAAGCGGSGAARSDTGVDGGADGHGPFVAAPDLRFKWVGAGFTLKAGGITNGGTNGSGQEGFSGAFGVMPEELTGDGSSLWESFSTVENLEPMIGAAASSDLSNLDNDLTALVTSGSIVVSLDSGPGPGTATSPSRMIYNALVIGTQSNSVSYLPFDHVSVAVSDFAAWAASEGAAGRVVTAVCPLAQDAVDAGQDAGAQDAAPDAGTSEPRVYATAFGRSGDTKTYETQVWIAPIGLAEVEIAAMARAGYIITAMGRDGTGREGAGNFIVVGTRIAGTADTRAVKILDIPCIPGGGELTAAPDLLNDGYAVVGQVFDPLSPDCDGSRSATFIGEK